MDIQQLVRKNIWDLKPYSSARHEFEGDADIFLDANENPFETGLNRYPDPLQYRLKQRISSLKGVPVDHIFLGNGSDEAIDLLVRIFCEPGKEEIIILPPTYGMYQVTADIAHVGIRKIQLKKGFQPDVDAILEEANIYSKLLFICSPNNPTGNCFEEDRIEALLKSFPGIVVIDEAYIDFSAKPSWITRLQEFPNLVVLQTFSKAWGLAGLRLGMAFANPDVIQLFNKVKPPYNLNLLTQQKALEVLAEPEQKEKWVVELLAQKTLVQPWLMGLDFVQRIYPSEANFILVKVDEPKALYHYLVERGIIVRDRSKMPLCDGCLRFTIGTPKENDKLMQAMIQFQPQIQN